MSTISAGTTSGTALVSAGNTDGTLQLRVNGTTPSVTLAANGSIGVGSTPGYGTSGQVLTSAGTGAAPTWTTPSAGALTLLATLTPTAAANVDALTTFTSSYDNYVILIDGVTSPAGGGSGQLYMRFANAGVVDTTAVYRTAQSGSADQNMNSDFLNLNLGDQMSFTNGRGFSGLVNVCNVNATDSTYKAGSVQGLINGNSATGTNYMQPIFVYLGYRNASAVSGVRFYWSGGTNFSAQGKIRIYGYANS